MPAETLQGTFLAALPEALLLHKNGERKHGHPMMRYAAFTNNDGRVFGKRLQPFRNPGGRWKSAVRAAKGVVVKTQFDRTDAPGFYDFAITPDRFRPEDLPYINCVDAEDQFGMFFDHFSVLYQARDVALVHTNGSGKKFAESQVAQYFRMSLVDPLLNTRFDRRAATCRKRPCAQPIYAYASFRTIVEEFDGPTRSLDLVYDQMREHAVGHACVSAGERANLASRLAFTLF